MKMYNLDNIKVLQKITIIIKKIFKTSSEIYIIGGVYQKTEEMLNR